MTWCEIGVLRRGMFVLADQVAIGIRHRKSAHACMLVDDGLASGFTMVAAIAACRNAGATRVAVAVPTGHTGAIERIVPSVDLLVCANVRGGVPFAVADAYRNWRDVAEASAELQLEKLR